VLNLHSMCVAHVAHLNKSVSYLRSEILVSIFPHVFVLLISSFSSAIYYLFHYETYYFWFIIFAISVCTSTSNNSISRLIAPLHFIAWSWAVWNCFFAQNCPQNPPLPSTQVPVHRSSTEALQNDMQITA